MLCYLYYLKFWKLSFVVCWYGFGEVVGFVCSSTLKVPVCFCTVNLQSCVEILIWLKFITELLNNF